MIEFILNDKKIKTDANKSMTLVDFIRENRSLKGTKIVCREGDCGACTVMVGELSDDKESIKYHSITSCISPLANAKGKHVVTVEGLNIGNKLNKIQQSIKDNYASQCGFCTPGFVVAMANYCLNDNSKTEQQMLDAISGNICRCTGYVSIINAAKELVENSKHKGQKFTLQQLVNQGFIPEYFINILDRLVAIKKEHFVEGETIIAGGTDLYVQKADELVQASKLRYITLEQGQSVVVEDNRFSISGIATVSDLFENQELNKRIPHLQDYLRLLSSEVIRNMATIAGNFVNASPIGDMSAFFLALDATLLIAKRNETRQVKLKDFFLDYKKTDLSESESIAKLWFNLPSNNCFFNFEKVSKREHLDIATVNTAIHIEIDNENRVVVCDLSVGGVAAIPLYLKQTCLFLLNKKISNKLIKEMMEVMNKEIFPISDVRGSSDYKRLLANQLVKAHFIKLFPRIVKFGEVA